MITSSKINTKSFFERAFKSIKITNKRTVLLHEIAQKIAEEHEKSKKVNLNFICTHNSRRSQLGQIWSFYASQYFGLKTIFSFSGGTEVTAFHRNTLKTLQKVGFTFHVIDFSHQNPIYSISFEGNKKSILGFSKTFDDKHNQQPFIAITTCNSADTNCPYTPSAVYRFHLPFEDPKSSDGTEQQEEIYLKTNQKMAAEVFVLFSEIKRLVSKS